MLWCVYALQCLRKSDQKIVIYIGITNHFLKRFKAHQNGKGAQFTKVHRPFLGTILMNNLSHSEALKLERKLKKLPQKTKLGLISETLRIID